MSQLVTSFTRMNDTKQFTISIMPICVYFPSFDFVINFAIIIWTNKSRKSAIIVKQLAINNVNRDWIENDLSLLQNIKKKPHATRQSQYIMRYFESMRLVILQ